MTMTLTLKEKELVAVGTSVAAGCKPCTDYHIKAVRAAKASDDEIQRAIADAVYVRRSALKIMEVYGLSQLGVNHPIEDWSVTESDRLKALVCIGAAFAANCTTSLETHLGAAMRVGISEADIQQVVKLARVIKGRAASHVKKLIKMNDPDESVQTDDQGASGCCGFGAIAETRKRSQSSKTD